ncbi:hypothetical protein Tco_0047831 [Tanacetum coccineum]
MVEKPVLNNKGRDNGQREIRPVWNNAERVNHQNKLTHPHPKNNFVLTAVATKSGQVPVNAAKQSSPRAAASISTARPVNTAVPKPKVNDALPTTYCYFKAHSLGNPQYTLQDQVIFDSGCSRHMTGNMSFLIDYQEINGGFVAFGGSPKRGKITGKEATSQLWKQPMNCQTYSHNQKYIGNMPKYQIIGDINSATQTRRMIKISEEHAMINDWIIDILEGQPKLGLWYPRDSPFDLEAFSDSDYAGASLDRKSTTGEIRENISSGMIPYEKKLIQVIKIHTDHNVADLLTKSFDVSRFNFLIA